MDRYRNKIVAFAGRRYEWQSIGIEEKLLQVLEELINKGYTIFMMAIMVLLIISAERQF